MESISLSRFFFSRDAPADRIEPTQQPAASAVNSSTVPLQPVQQPVEPAPKKDSAEKGEAPEPTAAPTADADAVKKPSAEHKPTSSENTDTADATSPNRRFHKKISAEDDGPCNHLKPKPVGYKSKYDFALVCRKSRVAQLTALTVQMYVIHSEWDRIGNFHFVLLFVALATHGVNTFMRWRGSTDGRFDIKQIYMCNSNNLRVQYALAVLSGPLLALFTYWCLIPQKISLVHATIYSIAAFIKVLFAVGCFCLELSEVTRDSIKPYLNYVKSFPMFN